MQHLSVLTAGWSYIPAGLTFGYLLMLPYRMHDIFVNIYQETMFWPYIVTIITLIISVALTNGLKLNYRKCQFVHLYVILAAMVFYMGAGFIFLFVSDVIPAIYLAACGLGLTLIPGLSYIHIRAPGRWRSVFMGLCYFWFLAGVAASATCFLYGFDGAIDQKIHTTVAICLLAGAGFIIILVAVIEMLQREGIIDYKKPLDFDTDIAHESGKLLNRREGRNLYSNFATSAPTTLTNGGVPKQWNSSTEQIIAGAGSAEHNYHKLWVFYMIFTKLQGFIAFYWIFVVLAVRYSVFDNALYPIFWFMVLGSLIGVLSMLVLSPKITFLLASILHTIGLILGVSFNTSGAGDTHMGVSFTVFYISIGASLAIPAINILELAALNFNETFLAIGSIMELVGIALIQYFGVTEVLMFGINPELELPADNQNDIIAAHFIAMIVLSVILQVIVLWHMPNTFKKTLAEINADLSRMTSYFAFSKMTVPLSNQPVATRTFTESITSDPPDMEEKQLSTRNGHFTARFNDRTNESTGRGSPYNDFSETRYNRRTIVEREMSPISDREDPYLQEQLQRQHESNYILSQQRHYQQPQARESPESQQNSYHPERRSENPYQQRLNYDLDNHFQERPRSSNSQPSRYQQPPPLLARQQYYEQFEQERQQSPQRKSPSIRQSPIPPVVSEPIPLFVRRPQQSQTVKSEPGFVPRPRLQTQRSEAPAPPPLPPADYLTKSLPRIKPDGPKRESIHPVLIPKPTKPQEEIIPGVEYSHNLRPSEFLRQSRQLAQFRGSALLS